MPKQTRAAAARADQRRDLFLEPLILGHQLGQQRAIIAHAIQVRARVSIPRLSQLRQRNDKPLVRPQQFQRSGLVRLAQAPRDHPQDALGETLVLIHEEGEILLTQTKQLRVGDGPDRRRAGIPRNKGHLAEDIPRPHPRQLPLADAAALQHRHLPRGDDIKTVAPVPFLEERLPRPAGRFMKTLRHQHNRLQAQSRKNIASSQFRRNVHDGLRLPLLASIYYNTTPTLRRFHPRQPSPTLLTAVDSSILVGLNGFAVGRVLGFGFLAQGSGFAGQAKPPCHISEPGGRNLWVRVQSNKIFQSAIDVLL